MVTHQATENHHPGQDLTQPVQQQNSVEDNHVGFSTLPHSDNIENQEDQGHDHLNNENLHT